MDSENPLYCVQLRGYSVHRLHRIRKIVKKNIYSITFLQEITSDLGQSRDIK